MDTSAEKNEELAALSELIGAPVNRADLANPANPANPAAVSADSVSEAGSGTALAEADAANSFASDKVGLGVDIVEIARMRDILARTSSFAEKNFSAAEREYCDSKAAPEVHYATRFAAKEAVLKALGTGFSEGIWTRDIEVRRTSKGRPYVVLTGRAREVAREKGVREIPISLSFTHDEAVACAMAITEDAVSAAKKRVDPMEDLAKQFKDARAMLDDLPATGVEAPAGSGSALAGE